MRIAIISDTHISPTAPAFTRNLAAVGQWIRDLSPDRVVHLGDGSANGAHDSTEYALLKSTLTGIPCPIHWVPGNHDIGENAATAPIAAQEAVTSASLSAWRHAFGPDYWSFNCDGWQIIGLNALLFGGEGPDTDAQWQWLQGELSHTRAKLGVMLHKPLFREGPADTEHHQRYLPPLARARLWPALRTRDLRFVLSGHTHQLRQSIAEGVEQIWAPSSAYRIPDTLQESIGRKVVGTMILELNPLGHSFTFVQPAGVEQHDITDHLHLYPDLRIKIAQRSGTPF
jgi:3',5'-cyclic AMP phosphodiesterase CpdA